MFKMYFLFSFSFLSSYIVQEDNSLVIKKLSMDDSAMFQCLASNDAGEKSSYTWLRVKSKFSIQFNSFKFSDKLHNNFWGFSLDNTVLHQN